MGIVENSSIRRKEGHSKQKTSFGDKSPRPPVEFHHPLLTTQQDYTVTDKSTHYRTRQLNKAGRVMVSINVSHTQSAVALLWWIRSTEVCRHTRPRHWQLRTPGYVPWECNELLESLIEFNLVSNSISLSCGRFLLRSFIQAISVCGAVYVRRYILNSN